MIDPVESHQNPGIATALAQRVGAGADAALIADALASIWQEIEAALTPIIGQRGVAALSKRTFYLVAPTYSWLDGMHETMQAGMDLTALKSVFAQQDSASAWAAGNLLLQTFDQLLASLVGPSLTERLLRSVRANSSSGPSAQDTSP